MQTGVTGITAGYPDDCPLTLLQPLVLGPPDGGRQGGGRASPHQHPFVAPGLFEPEAQGRVVVTLEFRVAFEDAQGRITGRALADMGLGDK